MAKSNSILTISSLRGGLNNSEDPPIIADDELVVADNVEFFISPLGERRLGCEAVDIVGAGIDAETVIVFLGVHNPEQTDLINNELWAVGSTIGTSVTVARRSGGIWSIVTVDDTLSPNATVVGKMRAVALHGKYFFMAKSNVDRGHVFDGTTFRRIGLAPPAAAPTAANTASGGSFADTRYYRVRFTVQDGAGETLLRSEPSAERTFSPSGSNSGVTVTRPAIQDGNETHWELEASTGDGNWFVIATIAIATTTYDDTISPATGYGAFTLSADIGDYTAPYSAKYVVADQDRLIFGGAWDDPNFGSRVSWTPPHGATGAGNDERIPVDTDNYVDLDWMSGGDLTGLSNPVNGSFYAFKLNRIYKLQRSGDIDGAYTAYQLSTTRGAIDGSVVNGADEYGGACVYFLDPAIGPCRIGAAGLQEMRGIRGTWRTVNAQASPINSHGIYYPDKQQVHWWVAVDGSTVPNKKIICQVNELRSSTTGSTDRGWSLADGIIASAWCSTVVPEMVTSGDVLRMSFRPYIGLENQEGGILRCDVGDTDNGNSYSARIVTKPYMLTGLLGKWGAMACALLASAIDDDQIRMNIKLIRDYGKEYFLVNRDFVPEHEEEFVNVMLDDLDMSQSFAMQVEFSDA